MIIPYMLSDPDNLDSGGGGAAKRPQPSASGKAVAEELEKHYSKRSNPLLVVWMLVASVGLFSAMEMRHDPLFDVAVLVAVLLIHEYGHYLGMRLFGCKDVRILFIPFFGAMTAGEDSQPSGAKRALIALLGPVPGILIGLVFLAAEHMLDSGRCRTVAMTFIWLNVLNLLPVFPLDGGQVLEALLFSRSRVLETVSKAVAAIALAALGFFLETPVLFLLTISILMNLRREYRMAGIAARAKNDIPASDLASERVPERLVERFLAELGLEAPLTAQGMAQAVLNIWGRMRNVPPTPRAATGLLCTHLAALLLGTVGPMVISVVAENLATTESVESRRMPDGAERRCVVTRHSGKLAAWAALADDGLFDGPAESYDLDTGSVAWRGRWRAGRMDGDWEFYGAKGSLERTVSFSLDNFVQERRPAGVGWELRKWEQLSPDERDEFRSPETPPMRAELAGPKR